MVNKGKNKAVPRRECDEDENEYLRQTSADIANSLDLRQSKKRRLAEGIPRVDDYEQDAFDNDSNFDYNELDDTELEAGMTSVADLQASYDELSTKLDKVLKLIAKHPAPALVDPTPAPAVAIPAAAAVTMTPVLAPSASSALPVPPAPSANGAANVDSPTPWYPVPQKKTAVTTHEVREKMHLVDDSISWLQFRMKCRDTSVRGGIDITKPWSQQPLEKMILVLDTIRDAFPQCRWFANNWGARFIVQEIFNHRRQHWMIQERKARRLPEPDPTKPRRGRKKKTVLPETESAVPPAIPSQSDNAFPDDGNAIAGPSGSSKPSDGQRGRPSGQHGRARSTKSATTSSRVLRSGNSKA